MFIRSKPRIGNPINIPYSGQPTGNHMSDESKRTWLTHPGKPGVIYREHPTRKIARKPDRFWAIRHRAGGKRLIETLGWTSEGWTADMAHALLVELQNNVKLGLRPQTLKEKRELAAAQRPRPPGNPPWRA